jgi:hypothetical protein
MYISLGGNCSITYQLNKYKLRNFLSPFDWSKITINQLIKVFEDTLTNNHIHKYTNLTIKYKSDKFILLYDKNNQSTNNQLTNNQLTNNQLTNNQLTNNQSTNNQLTNNQSLVLTNDYGIIFAHEILNKYDLPSYIKEIRNRFNNLLNLKTNINFIRIELSHIKQSYIDKIDKLINILNKLFNYNLILILPNTNLIYKKYDNVIYYFYDKFSDDWTMNDLDWNNILNI